jgi:hypothetical protein
VNGLLELLTQVRRDTTRLLRESLADPRLHELRVQGESMDRDQTSAYARTHIDEYLTHSAEVSG